MVRRILLKHFLLLLLCGTARAEPIDEVVVTTTRSEVPRASNPGNIAILDPTAIGSDFAADILNTAPGTHIQRGSGQEHLTAIRSPILVGGAGAGAFLYLEDGIAMRAAGFANINGLLDALPEQSARIEVTRGPGSAFYGSNALHGLVNFIARPLAVDETQIIVRAGSYGRHHLAATRARRGAVSWRTSVTLAGEADGWRDGQSYRREGARLQMGWGGARNQYRLTLSGTALDQKTAGYAASYSDRAIARANNDPNAFRDAWNIRGALRFERRLASGAIFGITPYFRANAMRFQMHFLPTTPLEENAHQSFGAQWSYTHQRGRFSYIFGLDSDSTLGDLRQTQTKAADERGNYLRGTHYDYTVRARTLAPFIHTDFAVNDRLMLTAGLRYEATAYDYDNRTQDGRQGRLYRPPDMRLDFADLAPKLGLTYRLLSGYTVFANLARAARAPQTTDLFRLRDGDKGGPLIPDPSAIDSETLDSFEIGYRGGSAPAYFELAVYTMRKRNYHFRDANDYYETAGSTTHQGVELDFATQFAYGLSLAGSLTHALHRYDFTRPTQAPQVSETIQDGAAIDSAPETLAHMRLGWDYHGVTLGLHLTHVGAYFMDASNSAEYGGHNLLDMTLKLALSRRATLDLRVANLADRAYAARADKWFGRERFFPGEPRNVMLGYRLSY